jgi:CubicO group peptidase (beta-lactamase class C family)
VISALTGILIRKGALTLDQPVPIAAWQGAGDPRHAITVNHLLRHTAGLAIGSSLEASLGAAFEPVNRTKFMESDMAAYAESIELATPPGSAWNYNDGNFIIPSHLIRNATGGQASDVMRFARQELFAPLGMRNVTLEFDLRAIRKDRARCWQPRATGRGSACSISMMALSGETNFTRGMGQVFRLADAERLGRIWRRLLDQPRRQLWRQLPDRARPAARCLLRQGDHRAICPHRAFRTAGHRAARPVAELAAGGRWRVRSRPRCRRGNRQQGQARRWRCGACFGVASSERMIFAATEDATM